VRAVSPQPRHLVVIRTANVLTAVVVTLARNGTIQPAAAGIASFVGSAAIDFVVFVTAFRVLTIRGRRDNSPRFVCESGVWKDRVVRIRTPVAPAPSERLLNLCP
jgi:hypothetical protein